MNTVVSEIEPRIKHIEVTEDTITAHLVDGSCYQRAARVVMAFIGCNRGTTEYMGTYRGRSRRALARYRRGHQRKRYANRDSGAASSARYCIKAPL